MYQILDDDIELVRTFEGGTNDAIDNLMERIETVENPEEIRDMLKRLAALHLVRQSMKKGERVLCG